MTNKNRNKPMADQLSNLTGRTKMNHLRNTPRLNFQFNHINNLPHYGRWQGDGVDHINISSEGRTDLGIALHTSFHLKFKHDAFGPFVSISQLWNKIDDMVGGKAINIPEAQLPFILADALWQKVQQYPRLAEEIKNSSGSFDMYLYNEVDLPFRNSMAYWWLEAIYGIRKALINGDTYPNFDGLIQGKVRSRFDIIKGFLDTYVPNRRQEIVEKPVEAQTETGPSLVKQLRKSPPVVLGFKKFSMSFNARTGERIDKTPKVNPVPTPAPVEPTPEPVKVEDLVVAQGPSVPAAPAPVEAALNERFALEAPVETTQVETESSPEPSEVSAVEQSENQDPVGQGWKTETEAAVSQEHEVDTSAKDTTLDHSGESNNNGVVSGVLVSDGLDTGVSELPEEEQVTVDETEVYSSETALVIAEIVTSETNEPDLDLIGKSLIRVLKDDTVFMGYVKENNFDIGFTVTCPDPTIQHTLLVSVVDNIISVMEVANNTHTTEVESDKS